MDIEQKNSGHSWERFCKSLRKKLNIGFFLEDFSIGFAFWIFLGGLGVFVFRSHDGVLQWRGGFILAGFLVISLTAWMRNRKRFFNLAETRIHVESRLKLNSRLTAAHNGVASWPDFPAETQPLLDWKWMPLLRPISVALFFFWGAHWIPLPFQGEEEVVAHQIPSALQEVETWVETLGENPNLDSTQVESWKEQLQALASKPSEDWYRNQNLEAADALHQNMEQALLELNQEATRITTAAEHEGILLGKNEGGKERNISDKARENLAQELRKLGSQGLPLNPALQEKLKSMDGRDFKTFSAGEMGEMLKSMEEIRKSCQACLGKKGDPVHEFAMGNGKQALGTEQDGEEKSAPLTLSWKESETDSQKREGMDPGKNEKPFLGEVVGVSTGEHKVIKERLRAKMAKQQGVEGSGGDASSKSFLTPDEEREMEKFFK